MVVDSVWVVEVSGKKEAVGIGKAAKEVVAWGKAGAVDIRKVVMVDMVVVVKAWDKEEVVGIGKAAEEVEA